MQVSGYLRIISSVYVDIYLHPSFPLLRWLLRRRRSGVGVNWSNNCALAPLSRWQAVSVIRQHPAWNAREPIIPGGRLSVCLSVCHCHTAGNVSGGSSHIAWNCSIGLEIVQTWIQLRTFGPGSSGWLLRDIQVTIMTSLLLSSVAVSTWLLGLMNLQNLMDSMPGRCQAVIDSKLVTEQF